MLAIETIAALAGNKLVLRSRVMIFRLKTENFKQ
jgi:hypothetical protein